MTDEIVMTYMPATEGVSLNHPQPFFYEVLLISLQSLSKMNIYYVYDMRFRGGCRFTHLVSKTEGFLVLVYRAVEW